MNIPYLDLSLQKSAIQEPLEKKFRQIMDSCQFVMGKAVGECEKKLAEFTQAPYALTVGSGTDALQMALMAAGIGPGDEVITTSFSFFATAETIVLVGATPVFVDIEPDTYNIRAEDLAPLVTAKTKAIMPVSLYGQVANMEEIEEVCQQFDLALIEDAAQSFGAQYKGKKSCNLSRFGCTSFFPAKPMGCYGDGGAIFCQTEQDYKALEEIRNHGQSSRYHHTRMGLNGRLDTLQCAVIDVKLDRYPWELEQRQRIAQAYSGAFGEIPSLEVPILREDRDSVWAQYTLRSSRRQDWVEGLKALGVPTSIHYPKGLHQQPVMKPFHRSMALPHCEMAGEQVFSLPLYADMPQAHLDYVIDAVKKVALSI